MTDRTEGRPLACVLGAMDLVRPLGLAGIRCHVVAGPLRPVRYSRFVVGVTDAIDPYRRGDELVDRLLDVARGQSRRPVLYYDNDGFLALVSRFRDVLEPAFAFVLPDADLVEDLIDKRRFMDLASRLDLPVPASRFLAPGFPAEDVDLTFPVILKPLTRDDRDRPWLRVGGEAKAVRIDARPELVAALPDLHATGMAFVAQSLIVGPESRIESYHVYADRGGTVIAEFTGRKIRTLPLAFGHSTALETTDAPDVAALGRQVIRRIGFSGVAKLDFKRDDDGSLHLLEINPRFTLWNHLGARAGVNIPALVHHDLTGEPRRQVGRARAGVTWCDVWRDARAARLSGMALSEWLPWAWATDVKADMALDDPAPFLIGKVAARPLRALRRGTSNDATASPPAVALEGAAPASAAGDASTLPTVRYRGGRGRRSVDVAILDAEQRQSLVAVRSLGRKGVSVGVFGSDRSAPAFYSKWCAAAAIVHDRSAEMAAFVQDVDRLVSRLGPRVLIPTHDGSIEALRSQRALLGDRTRLALAADEALEVAVDKSLTLDLAERLGIAVPRTVLVSDPGALSSALDEVGLPAVLKPVRSWRQVGDGGSRYRAVVAIDEAEARTALEELGDEGRPVAVQEWLSGAREAVSLLYAEGRIHARFAQVAYRMNPPLGGSSVVRESVPLASDLVEAAEGLVVAAGLEGYTEVEFRRGADDQPRLMEINPRLSASVEVAVRAGVDFPLLLYQWAAGLPLQRSDSYEVGVRMRWLGGDLRWLRNSLQARGRPDVLPPVAAVRAFVGDFLKRSSYDYIDRADMRPAVVAAREFARRATRE